jgi:membrane dipeptidase
MKMQRRNFLTAGVAGMALSLTRGPARAQVEPRADVKGADAKDTDADLSVVVIGTDGSDLLDDVVDKYLAAHADVWHFMPNLAKFSQVLEFIDKNRKIVLAKTCGDILAAKRAGKVAMVVGWQDSAGLTDGNGNDWRSSNPPKTKLREYYELGLRTANLTYQLSNQFGGGMLDPTVPLTVEGRLIVAQMQKLGIVVDVSGHTGVQTALDVIAMAERPVVITHGNVQALNDNPRCSPDAVIEGVARTGGLMGVAALSEFMTWGRKDAAKAETGPFPAKASLSRYVDEFDYLKKLVGVDHIALGTDFVTPGSGGGDPAQDFEYPPEMMSKADEIEFVDGFGSVSGLKNLSAEMQRRGYTAEEIAKILGGNWMRVFREAWNS